MKLKLTGQKTKLITEENLNSTSEYTELLYLIKSKIRNAQLKAVVTVNQQMLEFYWELGNIIIQKQAQTTWGDKLINQLSHDLKIEFPEMKGFSISNLKYMKQWVNFYSPNTAISQQAVGQIMQTPWGHNIAIISKCKNITEAIYYVYNTVKYNWSRSVLIHQIESELYQREGKAINNFETQLPQPQSDLASQVLKDPYVFDFVRMTKEYTERDLERELVNHISHFLLELGNGFAYIGKQVNIQVGGKDFYIDLLFYHTHLHSYVVVELKNTEFEPEHAGKLNFYIKAVDQQFKKDIDQPTIGLLICKSKNKIIAEYALSDVNKPIGVSEYQLIKSLPENLKPSLPSIEELEQELSEGKDK
ncbi:MAG: PDDEXK nuclease domain-containing protein [Burkholderiales bacterium]|nr:PDDEXK nuclease domain-containing protein [Burkholderiales bacterium]